MSFAKTVPVSPRSAIAIAAVVLLVAACGGSSGGTASAPSSSSTPSQAVATGAASAAPPTTTTTASAPTTTTTPSANTGPPPCRAADLSLSFLGGQGAAGHGELGFALRNTGAHSCTTIGYPGIQFLDRSGAALPTTPTHTTQDYFGTVPKLLLTVAPGATTSFRLGVTHGAASPSGCTTAYGLQVIAPNDTATLRASIPNGAYECQTATVSPLAQGASAFSGG